MLALVLVKGGSIGWLLASWLDAEEQAHRKSMEFQAEHNRLSKPEPQPPTGPENNKLDAEISNNIETLRKREGTR